MKSMKGFGLLEVGIVLIVVGILGVNITTSKATQDSIQLGLQVQQLQTDLEYARNHSLYDAVPTTVTFTGTGYSLSQNGQPLQFPSTFSPDVALSAGITLTAPISAVEFNNGAPLTTPVILPGKYATIELHQGDDVRKIRLYGQTGWVRITS